MDGASVNIECSSRYSIQPHIGATSCTYHDRVALQRDVLSLRREALALNCIGNVTEEMEQLWWAKLLEKELQDKQSQHQEKCVEASNLVETRKPRSENMAKTL